jgi:hypothetical protein
MKVIRIVEVLELTDSYAIAKLNNGYREQFEFTRPIKPEYTVLHWNGLTLDEVNAIVKYHNEKGFY